MVATTAKRRNSSWAKQATPTTEVWHSNGSVSTSILPLLMEEGSSDPTRTPLRGERKISHDAPCRRYAIESRHVHVHQHHIRPQPRGEANGPFSISGFTHDLVPQRRQHLPQ